MKLNTVIFDMDGLLIDSEPLWKIAADELFEEYQIQLSAQQYAITTGLRTKEFLDYWFTFFHLPKENFTSAVSKIEAKVIELVKEKGKPMAGVEYIFNFFIDRNFKIGLATSSNLQLINTVIDQLDIRKHIQTISSATELAFGKPHPEVYLNCATALSIHPSQCLCFEDSFNGLIAAKAARMKCVIIPYSDTFENPKWGAADLKVPTLSDFTDLSLHSL